ncbi:MAG: hypothetical protein MHPDNHAH_00182 [Anaerolineales bacterium]|nr:hypothetical protein [Anaerolineales bacterium]
MNNSSDRMDTIMKYYNRAWMDYSNLVLIGSLREEDLLPTRLGNILRASQQYGENYGLRAGVHLWCHLSAILHQNMASAIEEKNNEILFWLNSSLLSFITGLITFGVWALDRVALMRQQDISSYASNYCQEYLILSLVLVIFGYALYSLSIPAVKNMSILIRSSFDLYRFDLLKQLNIPIPKTLNEEIRIWVKISDFIVTDGNLGKIPLDFRYSLRDELVPQKQKTTKSSTGRSKKIR